MSHIGLRRLAPLVSLIAVAWLGGAALAQNPGSAGDIAADLVLGETDFNKTFGQFPGPTYINNPQGVAVDFSGPQEHLYVVLPDDNRVLGWSDVKSLRNNAPAVLVIGQTDFTTLTTPPTADASHLNSPSAIAVDSQGNLYVSDTADSRVLVFKTPFAAGCTAAAPCKGQAAFLAIGRGSSGNDFTDVGCNTNGSPPVIGVNATSLCSPKGLVLDSSDNLYVGDWNNARVLEFEAPLAAADGCAGAGSPPGCAGDVGADRVW